MNFISLIFLLFFIATFLIYWNIPKRARVGFLIFVSLFYYGFYSPAFLAHFIFVILLNYAFVYFTQKTKSRAWVALGVTLNITHLVFFKYFNALFTLLAPAVGVATPITFKVVMPLAISFYTFQFIAFQVDVYRGTQGNNPKYPPVNVSLSRYALFMLFFPHLISGPILRSSDFYARIGDEQLNRESQVSGVYLIALGLFKKLFIADAIGYFINPVFKAPLDYGSVDTLLVIFGYSAQLYTDFSGFIDMARGMAKLFGYDLPANFRSPYFSTSFSEFWARWHITLSVFIREYLYIPLGGNRVGLVHQYFNLMTAMVLSGIWHGETLNFFIWGALHGVYLCAEKILKVSKNAENSFNWFVRNSWVVLGWSFSLIFFRSPDFETATQILKQVFVWRPATLSWGLVLLLIIATWLIQFLEMRREKILAALIPRARIVIPALAVLLWFLISRVQIPNEAFIYVQF